MTIRKRALSTTMLTGVFGGLLLAPLAATASDIYTKAPLGPAQTFQPAVDGVNWKFGGLGGAFDGQTIAGGTASVSLPLGYAYGLQLDGAAGSFDGRFMGATGAHLFWRNPAQALFGVYGSFTHWDKAGGLNAGQVAGEGELYFGRFTLQGIAGVEFGNTKSEVVGAFIDTYDIDTRFFDKINLAYYFTDDLKAFVGHRYLGGRHALALGGEWAFRVNGPTMASLFVEGRVGEDDYKGIWGGLKFYVGQKDKSLIQRQRQDDPIEWTPETLFSISNSKTTTPVPVPAAAAPLPPPPPPPDGDGDGCGDCARLLR